MSKEQSDDGSQSSLQELSNGGSQSPSEVLSDGDSHSSVEITIGRNNLRIEGSEDFISSELSTILDRIDLGPQPEIDDKEGSNKALSTEQEPSGNGASPQEEIDEDSTEKEAADSQLRKVADRINVPYESLSKHFYLDDDTVHIHDPREIESKYALLGYCTIKEELTGDTYHDNTEIKKKLIDDEKVNIEDWGGTLLYSLRKSGYIKDNPNSQKSRFKPFKITPSGREEFVDWLNEDD